VIALRSESWYFRSLILQAGRLGLAGEAAIRWAEARAQRNAAKAQRGARARAAKRGA
jgi:hypothetical protein